MSTWQGSLRFATRLLGVAGMAMLVACGGGAPSDESESASDELAIGGTQGPGTAIPQESVEELPLPTEDIARAAPAKSVLNFTWQGQQTGYWCGPGSTRIALSSRMANPPSQQTLATYMGTTTNGTDHIGLPANALNKWLAPATPYRSRPMDMTPTQAQRDLLKKDILNRIGSGWPIVANVISGWRPPGYPSGTIYHYVTVMGYDQGGEKVLVADPAADGAAGASWKNVPRTYWISLHDLGTWIGGKGYTG